jgi:hypothetical protein
MNKKLVMSILISMFLIAAFTVSAQTPFVGTLEPQDDSGDGGVSTITMTTATETIDGKQVTTYTLKGENKRGGKNEYPTVQVDMIPDAATLAAIKNGGGVQFKATGSGVVSFEVCVSNVRDWCYHRVNLNLNQTPTLYSTKYSQLRQPSWGVRVPFNASRIESLCVLRDDSMLGPFEFKIWDIEILPK